MTRYILFLFFSLSAFFLQGQNIVSLDFLLSYTADELSSEFGINTSNDVELYKLSYTSVDLDGNPDTLSGLVSLPVTENLAHPLLVYSHGTVGSRDDVPSRLSGESFVVALAGALGYVGIGPDLLGLGDSNADVHPYLHADSEAWASYDMIKAIKEEGDQYGIIINDQLFISGYSQGGHTAMALHRYIETESMDGYEVTASSPASGPYSMSQETKTTILGDQEYFYVGYLANVVNSYQAAYGNILTENRFNSLYKEEYAQSMERFASGELDLDELNQELVTTLITNHGASIPRLMIREDRLDALENDPNDPLNLALQDNDVYDWAPQAPTRLYYCSGDDQVPYTNSTLAASTMQANGAPDVVAADLGVNSDHGECALSALPLTLVFFAGYMETTTSIDDYFEITSNVFPNPSNGLLYLTDNQERGDVIIMDLFGKKIYEQSYFSGQSLDLQRLDRGTYILNWKTDNKVESHKIVIH